MKSFAARTLAVAGLLVVCAAGIGGMHTAVGRRLMIRLGIACPVDAVDDAQVVRLRRLGLERMRGTMPAPAMTALGLHLGVADRADLDAWAERSSASCDRLTRGYTFLRCRGVLASALGVAGPPVSEVWFSFDASGRLIAVDLYRRGLDDAGAALAWSDARARMTRSLGAPTRMDGDASPSVLRSSLLQTARVEYRYSDYLATLTAVNIPRTGLAVREQYALAK